MVELTRHVSPLSAVYKRVHVLHVTVPRSSMSRAGPVSGPNADTQ